MMKRIIQRPLTRVFLVSGMLAFFLFGFLILKHLTVSKSGKEKIRSMKLPCTTWYVNSLAKAQAAVIGRVQSVEDGKIENEVVHEFVLDVSSVAGDCPELNGVKTIRSETYSEIIAGTWVIIYVHYYENKPDVCISAHDPIVIAGPDAPLARLFMRTGLNWKKLNPAEHELLRSALPVEYQEMKERFSEISGK